MRTRTERAIAVVLLAGAMLMAAERPAVARAEVIERVVAVVNDDAIFLSELRRRAAPFLEQVLSGANESERQQRIDKLYDQFLRELVDEQLIEQAARKMSIAVSSSEVDQAIENVRSQNNLTAEKFWEAVKGQGFTEKQYRADVRKQLLRLKVTNQRVRTRVNVNDATVKEEYEDRVRKARRRQRFHAAHVFMALPPTASATEVSEAMKKANSLRAALTADNFDTMMATHGGGDLGWLDQGDLPEALENALLGLEPGQIGTPVRGPSGIHIFQLRERQSGGAQFPPLEEAKETIYRELLDRAMARQQELFLAELRRGAVIEVRR
ncbi:MAG TPA: SurA N-terminal domain-containing protein [Polyangiales bacterium]|nr:SurA N-terminal domain-containing protein [Polyangiales bacterium]